MNNSLYINHMDNYTDSLTNSEKKALEIAMDHLGTSFSLEKSIGFISFSDSHEKK